MAKLEVQGIRNKCMKVYQACAKEEGGEFCKKHLL